MSYCSDLDVPYSSVQQPAHNPVAVQTCRSQSHFLPYIIRTCCHISCHHNHTHWGKGSIASSVGYILVLDCGGQRSTHIIGKMKAHFPHTAVKEALHLYSSNLHNNYFCMKKNHWDPYQHELIAHSWRQQRRTLFCQEVRPLFTANTFLVTPLPSCSTLWPFRQTGETTRFQTANQLGTRARAQFSGYDCQ